MARVRFFASIKDLAGDASTDLPGESVGEVLDAACARYGDSFTALLKYCSVVIGEERVDRATAVAPDTEIAVLPPVSGG